MNIRFYADRVEATQLLDVLHDVTDAISAASDHHWTVTHKLLDYFLEPCDHDCGGCDGDIHIEINRADASSTDAQTETVKADTASADAQDKPTEGNASPAGSEDKPTATGSDHSADCSCDKTDHDHCRGCDNHKNLPAPAKQDCLGVGVNPGTDSAEQTIATLRQQNTAYKRFIKALWAMYTAGDCDGYISVTDMAPDQEERLTVFLVAKAALTPEDREELFPNPKQS